MTRRRYLTEGLVVVVSILLAFGIDAAWAEITATREAHRLLESIRGDVLTMQAVVAHERTRSEERADRGRHPYPELAALRTGRA